MSNLTASKMPCHQTADSDFPKPYGECLTGHCDSGCLSVSHCASTCPASGTVGVVGSFYANTMNHAACDLFNTVPETLLARLPSRIFLPPKTV